MERSLSTLRSSVRLSLRAAGPALIDTGTVLRLGLAVSLWVGTPCVNTCSGADGIIVSGHHQVA